MIDAVLDTMERHTRDLKVDEQQVRLTSREE